MNKLITRHNNIVFEEKAHTYHLGDKQLMSVTTFLGTYSEPFDADLISDKSSKGDLVLKSRLLKDWSCSSYIGTHYHRLLELFCLKLLDNWMFEEAYVDILLKLNDEEHKQFNEGVKQIKYYLDKGYKLLFPELIIYDKELKLCGTADLIMIDEEDNILVLDFKTCKDIPKDNRWKNLYSELGHLEASKYNKYSLQLNVYKYMIEKNTDYKVRGMALLHIPAVGDGSIIECSDLQEEVKTILK